MTTTQLAIEGMHCGGCVTRVTNALKAIPGVAVKSVAVGTARVEHDENAVASDLMVQALNKMGFDARVEAGGEQ